MAIIYYAVCGRNIWRIGSTLNYINILQSLYFNVILHDNFNSVFIDLKKRD